MQFPRGLRLPTPVRRARILGLSLPIIGGMVSQNLLNLIDTAMVGQLGDQSLAAVGLGSFANFVAVAFVMGLSSGVQAMAARRKGEGHLDETALPLNGGLLAALLFGLPITLIVHLLIPHLFPLLTPDAEVAAIGARYLDIRSLAVVAVGANFAFRGYWNAVDEPKRYLHTLVAMHILNLTLNYLLIFGHFGFPEMGAAGAAAGSAIATVGGTLYYIIQALGHARQNGFLRHLPERDRFFTLLRLAVPAGVERLLFALSFLLFFHIIALLGTRPLAAATVLINLALVAILPAVGFGLTAGTLAGQALGRKEPQDAMRWGWEVALTGGLLGLVIGLPAIFFPTLPLRIFLTDPVTLEVATGPFRLMGGYIGIDTVAIILTNALLGVGASRTVMGISVTFQWIIFLPAAYLAGPVLGYGLMAVWLLQGAQRCMQAGVVTWVWGRGRWLDTKA